MKKKRKTWIVVLTIFILLQTRGYYVRNLKVDREFLEVIVEKVIYLEDKRINNIRHTWPDVYKIDHELIKGHMASKSNLEMDISVNTRVMSEALCKYYDEKSSNNNIEAEEYMNKYLKRISELQTLLEKQRKRHPIVEKLWERGIFK